MLRMLSGLASAAMRVLVRPQDADWADADDGEIDAAVARLMEREYGWHTRWGGSGLLYHKRDGDLAFASPSSFRPATSWDCAAKAAAEYVRGGREVEVILHRGQCGPRGLCVRLLKAHRAERPAPEIVCRSCGERIEAFPEDAEGRGWRRGYPSRDLGSLTSRFPRRGWGFMGQCPSCERSTNRA